MTTCPQSASWRVITFLMLSLQAFPSTALWQDQPWVRKYPCNQSHGGFPSMERSPFWIDSFRGWWDIEGDLAELKLDILAVHNQSLLTCEEIDVSLFKNSLDFRILGHPVGQLSDFRSNCPLPITETLTPIGNTLFSSYHLIYSFQSTHRLQTLESTFIFKQVNGNKLDCGIAKITPDLGETASATLAFTPFGVLIITTLSSWMTHWTRLSSSYVLDHESVLSGQELLWATVLDVSEYLRHLQFAFVSASMTIEYPGFYVPVVGKLAWASLLYWRGPFEYGYEYQGPNGGMYTSNASYGLGFMTQMLRYPNMLNTLANSMVNLTILMSPIFLILSLLFWRASYLTLTRPNTFLTVVKKAVGTTIGIALCFFSIPLLSYIAYDLILVGYLPNYRIGLAILMLLIICGASHFLTRTLYDQFSIKLTPESIDQMENSLMMPNLGWIKNIVSRHLPHTMPLFQAIGIGGLQGFPVAQLLVLILCECVYLAFHLTVKRDIRAIEMRRVFFSAIRLLTALLECVFVSSASEATRQWTGYVLLGIHGSVIVLGFFAISVWNLILMGWRTSDDSLDNINDAHIGAPSLDFHMDDLLASSVSSKPHEYRKDHTEESSRQHHQQDLSSFYRPPRSQAAMSASQVSLRTVTSNISTASTSNDPVVEAPFDINLALSEVAPRKGVDYSFREVDRFYGTPRESLTPTPVSTPNLRSVSRYEQVTGGRVFTTSITKLLASLRGAHNEEQERGFQVQRPPRPPSTMEESCQIEVGTRGEDRPGAISMQKDD